MLLTTYTTMSLISERTMAWRSISLVELLCHNAEKSLASCRIE